MRAVSACTTPPTWRPPSMAWYSNAAIGPSRTNDARRGEHFAKRIGQVFGRSTVLALRQVDRGARQSHEQIAFGHAGRIGKSLAHRPVASLDGSGKRSYRSGALDVGKAGALQRNDHPKRLVGRQAG